MLRATLLLLASLTAGFLLARCGTPTGPDDAPERPSVKLTDQEQRLLAADNRFSLKLFRAVNRGTEGTNLFLSPFSVSMALGMTLNGATGETRTAMEETLELAGLSPAEINRAYRTLLDLLPQLDPNVTFRPANSIWYRTGFTVEPAFIDTNRIYFDAEVAALDFNRADEARGVINNWVKDHTQGKIDQIVQQLNPLDVLFLINAVYFKGTWQYAFKEAATQKAPFFLPDDRQREVDMMQQADVHFPYYRSEDFQAIDLPYGDSLFSMAILMPDRAASIEAFAEALDEARWDEVLRGLQRTKLAALAMPKFRLQYEKELNDVLAELGMGVAFDPQQANFDGINPDRDDLYISRVKHKAFVEVNEAGTEAAAATSVGVSVTSAGGPPTVRIDRPFVFVIRERTTGAVLFIGKMIDPAA